MATVVDSITTEPPMNTNDAASDRNYWDERNRLRDVARTLLIGEYRAKEPGSVVGAIVRFPVADGCAEYMVKSQKRGLKLVHLNDGDAWHAAHTTIRGLRVSDVEKRVACDKRLDSLFLT